METIHLLEIPMKNTFKIWLNIQPPELIEVYAWISL